jgi:hypothetical protein
MKTTLLLFLLVPVFGAAERDMYLTDGRTNCRAWNTWPYEPKLGYLAGFLDARALFTNTAGDYYVWRNTKEETVKEITSTCSRAENSNIDIVSVLTFVIMKLRGEDDADNYLWRARLHANMVRQ